MGKETSKALIFDLDGTLIDTVYAHALAWQRAFAHMENLAVPASRLHEKIGLSGRLLALAIGREAGRSINAQKAAELDQRHSEIMGELLPRIEPLPGAVDLLRDLRDRKIVHAIATSSKRADMQKPLQMLGIPDSTTVVCSDDVKEAKPEPDLFVASSESLGITAESCFAIGDAVWDMLAAARAGMLSVGMTTGGIDERQLTQAGAYRVYRDPADLHMRLYELGIDLDA